MALVATVGIMQLANYMGNAQKKWVRGVQTRVDVTASMLGSMKVRAPILSCDLETPSHDRFNGRK